MNNALNIVLVWRTGGDFSFKDVDVLVYHLQEAAKKSMEIVNIYIMTNTVSDNVELTNGSTLIPLRWHWKGWWAKMNLFSPFYAHLRPFLYLDIDTAVIGDYTRLFKAVRHKSDFICLEDFYNAGKLASGMMWIPKELDEFIWQYWMTHPDKHMIQNRGDQDFLRQCKVQHKLFQRITDCIGSFKPNGKPLKKYPIEKDFICFHGKPRPKQAAQEIEWVNNYWNRRVLC